MQPDPDVLDPTGELSAHIAEQTREYGTYVATQRIYAGNALAYDVGHPVPISNVLRHGYWDAGMVALVEGADHPDEMKAKLGIVDDAASAEADGQPETDTGASTMDRLGV